MAIATEPIDVEKNSETLSREMMEDSQDPNGWDDVAGEDVSSVLKLIEKIESADEENQESVSEATTDPDAENQCQQASESFEDARDRVERFERLRQSVADREATIPPDDPYWVTAFYQIMESLEGPCVNDMQRPISLVSGCSGTLAEGWVLQ
ncbi:unnamed protein product, partial [Durusdinium trenchii]